MNRYPNQKYQLWPQIGLLFTVMVVIQSVVLWHFTWSWFEPSGWGAFKEHSPYIFSVLGYYIPWIDSERWLLYRERLYQEDLEAIFVLHLGLPILFSVVTSFCVVRKALWVRGGRENVIHVKGPVLIEGVNAAKHAKAQHKHDLKVNGRSTPGIDIHPKIKLCTQREQNNIAILGTTGAGKSMAFKPIVSQALNRGDYAIIYDEKGEYTSAFYNTNTTYLIAPWDSRSDVWNIFLDVRTKQEAVLAANCLVPDTGEKDKVWIKGARLLFVGMIMVLINSRKPWGWQEMSNMLSKSQDEMLDLLEFHFPIARTFIQKESKTTQGFYINLIGDLNWIEDLAIAWPKPVKRGFSVRKWVTGRPKRKVIIIQSDPRFDSIGAPLCNAIMSLITRNYLALEDNIERKTWLFVDEFANLPRNPMIKKWLELARSRGARSVLCTQSISQMREIYGNNDTDSILNLLSNVISLRVGSGGDDAKYISKVFGERIVERPNSNDPQTTWVRSREQLVEDFELTQLRPASNRGVEGYLFVPGWKATYKMVWPIFNPVSVAKTHSPAKWLKGIDWDERAKATQKNRLNKRVK